MEYKHWQLPPKIKKKLQTFKPSLVTNRIDFTIAILTTYLMLQYHENLILINCPFRPDLVRLKKFNYQHFSNPSHSY